MVKKKEVVGGVTCITEDFIDGLDAQSQDPPTEPEDLTPGKLVDVIFFNEDLYNTTATQIKFNALEAVDLLQVQSHTLDEIGVSHVLSEKQVNDIKNALDKRKAEVLLSFCDNDSKKPADSILAAKVDLDDQVSLLKAALSDAKFVEGLWESRRKSFESRQKDLHDEVSLIVCGFNRP